MSHQLITIVSQDGKYVTQLSYSELVKKYNSPHFSMPCEVLPCNVQPTVLPFSSSDVKKWTKYEKDKPTSLSSIYKIMEYLQPIDDSWKSIPDHKITLVSMEGDEYIFNFLELSTLFSFFEPLGEKGSWNFNNNEKHHTAASTNSLVALQEMMDGNTVAYANISPIFDMFILTSPKPYKLVSLEGLKIEEKLEVYKKIEEMLSERKIKVLKDKLKNFSPLPSACVILYMYREINNQSLRELCELYRYNNDLSSSIKCILLSQDDTLLFNLDEIKFCHCDEPAYNIHGDYQTKNNKYVTSVLSLSIAEENEEILSYIGIGSLPCNNVRMHKPGDGLGCYISRSIYDIMEKCYTQHAYMAASTISITYFIPSLELLKTALKIATEKNRKRGVMNSLDVILSIVKLAIKVKTLEYESLSDNKITTTLKVDCRVCEMWGHPSCVHRR